jgi:DNA invertase Pin-like site-specific DNA recombinase
VNPRLRLCGLLGVFAEFETNLRRERQAEGIAKAKAAGVQTYFDLEIVVKLVWSKTTF